MYTLLVIALIAALTPAHAYEDSTLWSQSFESTSTGPLDRERFDQLFPGSISLFGLSEGNLAITQSGSNRGKSLSYGQGGHLR